MNRSIQSVGITLVKIAGIAFVFRMAVYFLSFCIMILFGDHGTGFGFQVFLNEWIRWDANHYINIAGEGYANLTENGQHLMLVFFPLYPWLIRLLSEVIPNPALCGILISTFAYSGGCCYLYLWMKEEPGGEAAKEAVILISIFPFAFFFGGIMTESLFLLLSTAVLYYGKKGKWALAGIFLFMSALTRLQGLLLILPVLTEILVTGRPMVLLREKRWKETVILAGNACLTGMCTLAGLGIYLGINARLTGNPFQFSIYQKEHWWQSFGFLPDTIRYLWEYARNHRYESISMSIWIPELVLFVLAVTVLLYGIRRLRASMTVYLLAYIICVYSATWLLSAGRYLACAVPLFMAGGQWLAAHPKWTVPVYWLCSSLFMMYLIGFFLWKDIM